MSNNPWWRSERWNHKHEIMYVKHSMLVHVRHQSNKVRTDAFRSVVTILGGMEGFFSHDIEWAVIETILIWFQDLHGRRRQEVTIGNGTMWDLRDRKKHRFPLFILPHDLVSLPNPWDGDRRSTTASIVLFFLFIPSLKGGRIRTRSLDGKYVPAKGPHWEGNRSIRIACTIFLVGSWFFPRPSNPKRGDPSLNDARSLPERQASLMDTRRGMDPGESRFKHRRNVSRHGRHPRLPMDAFVTDTHAPETSAKDSRCLGTHPLRTHRSIFLSYRTQKMPRKDHLSPFHRWMRLGSHTIHLPWDLYLAERQACSSVTKELRRSTRTPRAFEQTNRFRLEEDHKRRSYDPRSRTRRNRNEYASFDLSLSHVLSKRCMAFSCASSSSFASTFVESIPFSCVDLIRMGCA